MNAVLTDRVVVQDHTDALLAEAARARLIRRADGRRRKRRGAVLHRGRVH